MTNLERLQEMSYEEMASFLLGNADEPCSYCPPRAVCKTGPCQTCWEDWLRGEAKADGECGRRRPSGA